MNTSSPGIEFVTSGVICFIIDPAFQLVWARINLKIITRRRYAVVKRFRVLRGSEQSFRPLRRYEGAVNLNRFCASRISSDPATPHVDTSGAKAQNPIKILFANALLPVFRPRLVPPIRPLKWFWVSTICHPVAIRAGKQVSTDPIIKVIDRVVRILVDWQGR